MDAPPLFERNALARKPEKIAKSATPMDEHDRSDDPTTPSDRVQRLWWQVVSDYAPLLSELRRSPGSSVCRLRAIDSERGGGESAHPATAQPLRSCLYP